MKKAEIALLRDYKVVKHNNLIQRSRYELSTQEQKIILYLITKIKPDDDEFHLYEFNTKDFCEVCGIDETSGKNYSDMKKKIKTLADKSMWAKLENGKETLLRWIEKPYIDENSGIIEIRFDKDMRPYLLQLKEHFTAYNLYYTLAMKGKYSIRIYELLKSYENLSECIFNIAELKKALFAENYKVYKDFRVKVIDMAIREINEFSDINVTYTVEKKGQKVDKIYFKIKPKKNIKQQIETFKKIEKRLNPQEIPGQQNIFMLK